MPAWLQFHRQSYNRGSIKLRGCHNLKPINFHHQIERPSLPNSVKPVA